MNRSNKKEKVSFVMDEKLKNAAPYLFSLVTKGLDSFI